MAPGQGPEGCETSQTTLGCQPGNTIAGDLWTGLAAPQTEMSSATTDTTFLKKLRRGLAASRGSLSDFARRSWS